MGWETMRYPSEAERITVDIGGVRAPQDNEPRKLVVYSIGKRMFSGKTDAIYGLREEIRQTDSGEVLFSQFDGAIKMIYDNRSRLDQVQLNWARSAYMAMFDTIPVNFDSDKLGTKDGVGPWWFANELIRDNMELQVTISGLGSSFVKIGFQLLSNDQWQGWKDLGDKYDVVLDDTSLVGIPIHQAYGDKKQLGYITLYFRQDRQVVDLGWGVEDKVTLVTMQKKTNASKLFDEINKNNFIESKRFPRLLDAFSYQSMRFWGE